MMSAIPIDNENAICVKIFFLQFHELEIKTFYAIQRSGNGTSQLFWRILCTIMIGPTFSFRCNRSNHRFELA